VHPELVADYVGWVRAAAASRRTASAPLARDGSEAQLVLSLPIDYSDGRREAGSDYVTGCMLPHAAAQAGRLFRFQRMTPVELTYSGLAADENWAYERSSRFMGRVGYIGLGLVIGQGRVGLGLGFGLGLGLG